MLALMDCCVDFGGLLLNFWVSVCAGGNLIMRNGPSVKFAVNTVFIPNFQGSMHGKYYLRRFRVLGMCSGLGKDPSAGGRMG